MKGSDVRFSRQTTQGLLELADESAGPEDERSVCLTNVGQLVYVHENPSHHTGVTLNISLDGMNSPLSRRILAAVESPDGSKLGLSVRLPDEKKGFESTTGLKRNTSTSWLGERKGAVNEPVLVRVYLLLAYNTLTSSQRQPVVMFGLAENMSGERGRQKE